MLAPLEAGLGYDFRSFLALALQRSLVFRWDHLDELLARDVPVFKEAACHGAAGEQEVLAQHGPDRLDVLGRIQGVQLHHFRITAGLEAALGIPNIGDSAGHARRKIASRGPQDEDPAAGHVFASVVAHALDDRVGPRVPDAETLAGPAP